MNGNSLSFLSWLGWLFGRRQKKERVDKYAATNAAPLTGGKRCLRAEARRKKRALWNQFRVSGDPSGWKRGYLPIPRWIRRKWQQSGEDPEVFIGREQYDRLVKHEAWFWGGGLKKAQNDLRRGKGVLWQPAMNEANG